MKITSILGGQARTFIEWVGWMHNNQRFIIDYCNRNVVPVPIRNYKGKISDLTERELYHFMSSHISLTQKAQQFLSRPFDVKDNVFLQTITQYKNRHFEVDGKLVTIPQGATYDKVIERCKEQGITLTYNPEFEL